MFPGDRTPIIEKRTQTHAAGIEIDIRTAGIY